MRLPWDLVLGVAGFHCTEQLCRLACIVNLFSTRMPIRGQIRVCLVDLGRLFFFSDTTYGGKFLLGINPVLQILC